MDRSVQVPVGAHRHLIGGVFDVAEHRRPCGIETEQVALPAEVGMAILRADAHIVVEHPLAADPGGPADQRLRGSRAGRRSLGQDRVGRRRVDKSRVHAGIGKGDAGRAVEQRAPLGDAEPAADRGHPVAVEGRGRRDIAEKAGRESRQVHHVARQRGADAGGVDIAFDAEHPFVDLPVVAGLGAPHERGVVGAATRKRRERVGHEGDDRTDAGNEEVEGKERNQQRTGGGIERRTDRVVVGIAAHRADVAADIEAGPERRRRWRRGLERQVGRARGGEACEKSNSNEHHGRKVFHGGVPQVREPYACAIGCAVTGLQRFGIICLL